MDSTELQYFIHENVSSVHIYIYIYILYIRRYHIIRCISQYRLLIFQQMLHCCPYGNMLFKLLQQCWFYECNIPGLCYKRFKYDCITFAINCCSFILVKRKIARHIYFIGSIKLGVTLEPSTTTRKTFTSRINPDVVVMFLNAFGKQSDSPREWVQNSEVGQTEQNVF